MRTRRYPTAEGQTVSPPYIVAVMTEGLALEGGENLPRQFDEYIWFDEGRAIDPLKTAELKSPPDTYRFGL